MESSVRQVNYGVVGFNGEGVDYLPHFHTGSGKLNMDSRGLQTAIDKLNFAENEIRGKLMNPMEAIEFVVEKYPFRGASRKLLVLLTCSNCESFDVRNFITLT